MTIQDFLAGDDFCLSRVGGARDFAFAVNDYLGSLMLNLNERQTEIARAVFGPLADAAE
jgi:hypothetical protein